MNKKIKIIVIVVVIVAILLLSYVGITKDMVLGVKTPSISSPSSYYDVIDGMLDTAELSKEDVHIYTVDKGHIETGGKRYEGIMVYIQTPTDIENSTTTVYTLDFKDRKLEVEVDDFGYKHNYMTMSDVQSYMNLYEEISIAEIVGYTEGERCLFNLRENEVEKNYFSPATNFNFIIDGEIIALVDATQEQIDTLEGGKVATFHISLGEYGEDNYRSYYFYTPAIQ